MPTCFACHEEKPLAEFSRRSGRLCHSYCKPCTSAKDRARYAAKRERLLALMRAYRVAHREEIKAQKKAYNRARYAVMPEAWLVRNRAWKKRNREQVTVLNQAWRRRHPEQYAEYVRAARRNRRARLRAAVGRFSAADWQALKAACGFRCLRCLAKEPRVRLVADHVIPLSRGGTNDITNIQPLCRSCNGKKHAETVDFRYAA